MFLIAPKDRTTLSTQHIVLATTRGSELTLDYGIRRFTFGIEAGEMYALAILQKISSSKTELHTRVNGKNVNTKTLSPPYSVLDDVEVHYGSPDYPPADVEVNRFYCFG